MPSKTPNKFRAKPRQLADFAAKVGRVIPDASLRTDFKPGASGITRPTLNVIDAINGQLVTRHSREAPRMVKDEIVADPKRDILKIAVVNRYVPHAPVAVGFIRGFGLKSGALASSVAHDSHNVVAVGTDDESLCAAVNLVIKNRGGLSFVGRRKRAVLPLPIAGLMSDRDGRSVAARYTLLDRLAKKAGSKLDAPFMTLSFMALLVIPDLKLSDRGLFSAAKWGFVPLCE